MNTIFGTFMEKVIPNLKNAIIKLTIGGNESEMSLEDLKANIVPAPAEPSYKVYTALLTQSVEDDILNISGGDLTIGVTYYIDDSGGGDFTNVGAPNNDFGTYFVATGTTPNSWGTLANLLYDTGAPVVTVLENTIGNVWFTYNGVGYYQINSDGLFIYGKTYPDYKNIFGSQWAKNIWESIEESLLPNTLTIVNYNSYDNVHENGIELGRIEIRVYN